MTGRRSVGYFGDKVTLDSRQLRFNRRHVGDRIVGDLARTTLPGEVTLGWGLVRGADSVDLALFDQEEHPYVVAIAATDRYYVRSRSHLQEDGAILLPKEYLESQGRRVPGASLEMRIARQGPTAVLMATEDMLARAALLRLPDPDQQTEISAEIQTVYPDRERVANALTPLVFADMFPGAATLRP